MLWLICANYGVMTECLLGLAKGLKQRWRWEQVIGRGSFAKVLLTRLKRTGQLFAMKSMSKSALARKEMTHSAQVCSLQ